MTLKFKDASDYSGRDVNENLYNIRLNSDRLSVSTDIIFSIHFNGFNEKASGTEMWSYLGDNISKPVAVALSTAVAEAQGIPNRGQKSTTDLYVVANTKAHMILMEICFLDNKQEIENYNKKEQKVIDAIINVCKQFPHLTFAATSAGHGGLNMMDPGVSRHGYKENVLAQRINKAIINYKLQPEKPIKPLEPANKRPRQKVETYWYGKESPKYKQVKKYLADKNLKHAEEVGTDGRIKIIVSSFNQDSDSKYKLEKYLSANDMNFIVDIA